MSLRFNRLVSKLPMTMTHEDMINLSVLEVAGYGLQTQAEWNKFCYDFGLNIPRYSVYYYSSGIKLIGKTDSFEKAKALASKYKKSYILNNQEGTVNGN